jgi:hypothetical protein
MRRALAAAAAVAAALAGTAIAGAADRGRATCTHQAEASFPGAYASARNLRVGPLVLVGGRTYSSPETVRRFGGQKYPALLAAGHTARIEISPRARRTTSLTWAAAAHGTRRVEDGLRVVGFRACGRRASQSDADGRPVTFWSGFILTTAPRCLRMKVWIDGARTPRRVRIPLGRRC